MIIRYPITQEQQLRKKAAEAQDFQDDLNQAYDYLLTDLMTRIAQLEGEVTDDGRADD